MQGVKNMTDFLEDKVTVARGSYPLRILHSSNDLVPQGTEIEPQFRMSIEDVKLRDG